MPFCPRSSVRSERHHAKVEVASAIPAVDAILPLCLSSHRTSFVNSYSSVRVRPEAPAFACRLRLGGPVYGDHDVTAASRPVKAFVPVRIRLVTPNFPGAPISKSACSKYFEPDKQPSCIHATGSAHWLAHRGSNPHVGGKPTPL